MVKPQASFIDEQWWNFDHRTRSIRAHKNKNFAISHNTGGGVVPYTWVTLRTYQGRSSQRVAWFANKRQQIRDTAENCLNVVSTSRQLPAAVTYTRWLPCKLIDSARQNHGGYWNQDLGSSWILDTNGHQWQKYPLNNG